MRADGLEKEAMSIVRHYFRQLLLGSLREEVPQGSAHAPGEPHQHPLDSSVGMEVIEDQVGQEAGVLRPPVKTVLSKGTSTNVILLHGVDPLLSKVAFQI